MANEIKKIKIKELPQTTSISDDNIFIESDTLKTYKVIADDVAKYVSTNKHLTDKYVPLNSVGVANGVAPLNSSRKINGTYITYGTTTNSAYEGNKGKTLEQNVDNHLIDEDAHGYNTKINAEIERAKLAESTNESDISAEITRATTAENNLNSKKANIASPTLTGTPKAPTASVGTNTNQIATTSFVQTSVSNHNTSVTSHSDIRSLISDIATRLNTLADSDDATLDQMSEIVAYIKSNKTLIENITTNKVNISDIVNNLTSTSTNKPLSAKQGNVLYDLIDTLAATVSTKVDGVKGNAESSYRTGNVNITPEDIGLGHVEDKSSETIRGELTREDVISALGYIPGTSEVEPIIIDDALSSTSVNPVQNKIIYSALEQKANTEHTHDYLPLSGGTVAGTITADKFYGSLDGTASKAEKDSSDQIISSTYIKNLSVSGVNITYTKGDGSTGLISTQDTDTKNTAGSTNTSSKIFLIGATSQAANPKTYSRDTAYVGINGCLYSNDTRVVSEIIATTEPTDQVDGDYWLCDYD